MPSCPPVAIFVFNRPAITRRLIEALETIRPEHLLVVADGPRHEAEARLCHETRALFEQLNWPCQIETCWSESNMGCRDRVSSGLDWVFSRVERAIILEDDCIPHPDFFPFCAALLEHWKDDERVMMISGTNYQNSHDHNGADYFFARYYAVWGWATWRRAWRFYDLEMRDWPDFKRKNQLRAFFQQDWMRAHLSQWFDQVRSGALNTWDVQWLYSCLMQNGLCIVPRVNLIHNIGVEGAHASASSPNHFRSTFDLDSSALAHPRFVTPDLEYEDAFFRREFAPPPQPWPRRALGQLWARLPSPLKRRARRLLAIARRRRR